MMKLRFVLSNLLAAGLVLGLSVLPARAAAEEAVIVALGDSLTAGYGLPKTSLFPRS